MKIRLYINPNIDPTTIADQVKAAVEAQTDKPCVIKITGDPTRPVKIKLAQGGR